MEYILKDEYKFIKIDLDGAVAVFSTARNNLDFNKLKDYGIKNIENLKNWFGLDDVGYLNQVHGDRLVNYDEKLESADGLFTNKVNTAVGVFNADCAPILLYDRENSIIAAVHSGWRGTLSLILKKAIKKLKSEYNSRENNIFVCIGPHIQVCCYEIGKELMDRFKKSDFYKGKDIFEGRNLDLKKCLFYQLESEKIRKENIKYVDICTCCEKKYDMHSYRKDKNCGRMFSFIYLK
ncbi:peptidoglycan editing factor PgeF [Clostridium sp. LBM24168]